MGLSRSRMDRKFQKSKALYLVRRRGLDDHVAKIDRAAERLAREGLGQIDAVYRDVFGTGIVDPSIAGAIDARIKEFRSNPRKMQDCKL